ncbi:MAG: hypothetical protein HYS80_02760, partial [Candidatus Aenigmarchaeota archaeon]|nr:hypothetical protein [Candidatus Aenigmarchaeota archaeon]
MFGPGATKQGDEFLYSFKEFIESLGPNTKNFSTYQYLKKLSGLTEQELANLGISPGAPIAAEDLIFKVKAGDTVGSLYSVVGGEHKLVAKNLMLQSFGDDHYDWASIVDKKRGVNRIAYAVMQNMNLFAEQGFNAEQVLSRTVPQGEKGPVRPTHIPVPAEAPYRPRTIAAFAMERFNRLLQGFGDQIGINIPGIKSGPASHMYLRFGGYAAGIGLGILGVRELDFFRRRFGEPAHVLASAGISGGVAWALKKAGFKPKTQFFGALASFAGQMLLPGFRQGTVEGLATTAATVSQFRAFELNPFNYYRRALEGYLPGISDWKVGALLGVGT